MTAPVTSLRRSPSAVWAAARGPLAIAAVIVTLAVLTSVFTDRGTRGLLDPDAVDASGSRALAQLVRAEGVTVDVARTAADVTAAGGDVTVLVPFPDELSPLQLDAVRSADAAGADIVLVAPGQTVLDALAAGMTVTAYSAGVDVLDPACPQPDAVAAGRVELGGELYSVPAGGIACYQTPDGAAFVQLGAVTALGAPDLLTNGALANEGNAALAMRLLGRHDRLVWFRAVPEGAPVEDQRSFVELIPAGWKWATGMLLVAFLLAVVWRARRLGRVVSEPLPVVVRAAETVEGRARLYRRGQARGHATDVLRHAARTRLAPLVGLPVAEVEASAPAPALVAAVAARTGRPPGEVESLLYGPAPVNDAAMIDVARALDACEAQVRRS